MSLFQVKEYAQAKIHGEYDEGSFVVSHLNSQENEVILMCTLQGEFKILCVEDNEIKCLLSKQFPHPILQVKYCSIQRGQEKRLLLLSFFALKAYKITLDDPGNPTEGVYTMELVGELPLSRKACLFDVFRRQGKEMIAIRSLDGSLSLFVNGREIATVDLGGEFLFPAPFSYLTSTDMLLIANAQYEVCAYTITELHRASDIQSSMSSQQLLKISSKYSISAQTMMDDSGSPSIDIAKHPIPIPRWKVPIGERVHSTFLYGGNETMIVSRHNIIWVRGEGEISRSFTPSIPISA
ncbi:Parathyroid hormone-responsive B1 like protein, partial [Aduncisulcus paluster]